MRRKALVAGVFALAAGLVQWQKLTQLELGRYTSKPADWDKRREKVKEAFVPSWDAYSKYAWG